MIWTFYYVLGMLENTVSAPQCYIKYQQQSDHVSNFLQ